MKILLACLLSLCHLPAAVIGSARLADVTVGRISSAATDCSDYTHAIQLKEDVFLLYLLTEESLSVRLEVEQERWVAFGVSSPDNPGKMVGSDAVIGLPLDPVSSRNPAKYYMVGEDVGDVFPRASSSQTLQNADVWQENGSTYLAFTKQLQEDNDNNDEHPITTTGTNYFLWAYGLEQELGVHDEDTGAGAFAVDAASTLCIPTVVEETTTDEPAATATTEAPAMDDPSEDQDPQDTTISGESSASLTCDDYQHLLQITEDLRMAYVVTNGTMKVQLELQGEAWVSLGVSPNGKMVGGEAVIGLPDEAVSSSNPGEYSLLSEEEEGVVFMDSSTAQLQTLTNTSLVQSGDGTTVMSFTKKLSQDDSSETTFIWAYGFDNALKLHKANGSFQLRLEPCTENTGLRTSSIAQSSAGSFSYDKTKVMWTAHAFLGLVAWAILAPVAISASWLRQLLPDGWWFKIHFYSNVLVLLLTFATFVVAVLLYKDAGEDHFAGTHEAMGLVIMIVVVLQALAGIFRPSNKFNSQDDDNDNDDEAQQAAKAHEDTDGEQSNASDSSDSQTHKRRDSSDDDDGDDDNNNNVGQKKARVAWEVSHRLVGFILLIVGLWQVQSGIVLYSEEYNSQDYTQAFWIYVGGCLAILLLLTVYVKVRMVQ